MSDPSFAGVAILLRIRDLYKSKIVATKTMSNQEIQITFDINRLKLSQIEK